MFQVIVLYYMYLSFLTFCRNLRGTVPNAKHSKKPKNFFFQHCNNYYYNDIKVMIILTSGDLAVPCLHLGFWYYKNS